MNQFVLIFRMDIETPGLQPTPGQMKLYMEEWDKWIRYIQDRKQLAEGGNHLSVTGKVLRRGILMTDGPYMSGNEAVVGYILIKAKDMEDALGIARKCPMLDGEGTSVEVRETSNT